MAIRTAIIPQVVATGSAGSATGSAKSAPVNGLLLAIGVAQGNTPHANTDITVAVEYSGKARTLLTLTNYNTTALTWYDVRELIDDTVGAAGTQSTPIPLDGEVSVSVAQGGSAATCDVVLIYAE